MKSESEIGHIESSHSGRQRIFPLATAGGKVGAGGKDFPATVGDFANCSKSSIFDSLF